MPLPPPLPKPITRNSATLESFVDYCEGHPQERFWQALLNWSGVNYILISNTPVHSAKEDYNVMLDPYYWEGRNG